MGSGAFWDEFEKAAAALVRPLGFNDGIFANEIGEAETRLGFRLPKLLREYYLKAGRFEEVNKTVNALLDPEELRLEHDSLVFYEEGHGVAAWAIRLADIEQDDPPVYQIQDSEMFPEEQRVSEFLLTQFYWQTVNAMEYSDTVEADAAMLKLISKHWPRMERGSRKGEVEFYGKGGQLLCVMGGEEDRQLAFAGKTEADYDAIVKTLGLEEDEPIMEDEDE